jgi:hypothetical protein
MNSSTVQVIARQSRIAARQLSSTSETLRNLALSKMADSLESVMNRHTIAEGMMLSNPVDRSLKFDNVLFKWSLA